MVMFSGYLRVQKYLEMNLPVEKTILWHKRLYNIGEKRALKNKNLIEGLDDYNLEFNICEYYIYGEKSPCFLLIYF